MAMPDKRAATVTLDRDLLEEAERTGIDLSQTLESELRRILEQQRREDKWRAENREAIASFNDHIRRNGTIGDDYRTF